jgi:hypothetical protein
MHKVPDLAIVLHWLQPDQNFQCSVDKRTAALLARIVYDSNCSARWLLWLLADIQHHCNARHSQGACLTHVEGQHLRLYVALEQTPAHGPVHLVTRAPAQHSAAWHTRKAAQHITEGQHPAKLEKVYVGPVAF